MREHHTPPAVTYAGEDAPLIAAGADALTTSACPAQRWRLGRAYWRVDRDEGFRRQHYTIDGIDQKPARAFVETHHYSSSYPFALARVGLFQGRRLVGVAIFSTPINSNAVRRYAGLDAALGVELGRFILLNRVPYNAESFFLAGAFAHLRREMPDVKAVIAYSDPVPRATASGELIMPGHVGTIYQAGNGRYVGRSSSQTMYLTDRGVALSTRGLSKIRRQEYGAASAEKRLRQLGAPARRLHQHPAEWIDELLAGTTFRKLRHPGNHVYVWPLGTTRAKRMTLANCAPGKAYPKSLDAQQRHLFAP